MGKKKKKKTSFYLILLILLSKQTAQTIHKTATIKLIAYFFLIADFCFSFDIFFFYHLERHVLTVGQDFQTGYICRLSQLSGTHSLTS